MVIFSYGTSCKKVENRFLYGQYHFDIQVVFQYDGLVLLWLTPYFYPMQHQDSSVMFTWESWPDDSDYWDLIRYTGMTWKTKKLSGLPEQMIVSS
jgi:hypothetical protein